MFVQNPWPGNAGQIRFGVNWLTEHAPTEWVLFLDCDEICSPELAESIQTARRSRRQYRFLHAAAHLVL